MGERGVDVSDNNPEHIDWARASGAGISFAYVKATEGMSYVNPYLSSQWHGARFVGITTGLYHFAHTANSPFDDARSFAAVVEQYQANQPGCLPPCLDIEVRCSDPNAWVYHFITTLWGLAGHRPVLLYSPASWWSSGYLHQDWAPEVNYWVASWGTPPAQPSWTSKQVVSHQYTSNGRVDGIDSPVDVSYAVQPISQWMLTA